MFVFALFTVSIAMAEFSGKYPIATPDELIKLGWNVQQNSGGLTATHKEYKSWKIVSEPGKFQLAHYSFDEGRLPNYDYSETTPDGKMLVARTHCYPKSKWDAPAAKPACHTVTAAYCGELKKLTSSKIFSSDISKLTECG